MRVAVAVIVDEQQRILITRRPLHAPHGGGMWEFPGGKLEQNETPIAALIREIKEEVDLDVHDCDFLGEINHTYPHHSVELHVYRVHSFHGEAVAQEMQIDLRWVEIDCLQDFEFPEANVEIIRLIRAAAVRECSRNHQC